MKETEIALKPSSSLLFKTPSITRPSSLTGDTIRHTTMTRDSLCNSTDTSTDSSNNTLNGNNGSNNTTTTANNNNNNSSNIARRLSRSSIFAARKISRVGLASYGHERKFKCTLTITKKNGCSPVYFKWDGNRFETSSETIKLQVNTAYIITIDIQPSTELL